MAESHTTDFPIPEGTLAVECWMTNPPQPGGIAVRVDGKLVATVQLEQFKATADRPIGGRMEGDAP